LGFVANHLPKALTDLTGAAEINLTCEPQIDWVMHVPTEINIAKEGRVIPYAQTDAALCT